MKKWRSTRVFMACAVLTTLVAGAGLSQYVRATDAPITVPAPDYTPFTQSVHIPFARPVKFSALRSLDVRVSINGGPVMTLQVDTGSVGVIVGAANVPDIDPKAPPGSINYVSSGHEFDGVRTLAKVTFVDAKGPDGQPVVAEVPVLAVNKYVFHPGKINGGGAATRPDAAAHAAKARLPNPHMLGIGFGRGKDGHPEYNPFINLTQMQAGTMRRGYMITPDGITLGLAGKTVDAGFSFEKLTERAVSPETKALRPGLKDWNTATGSMTIGQQPPRQLDILMDTGLTNMMLEFPEVTANTDLPQGTHIAVDLPAGLRYAFNVGEASPVTPRRVSYVHRDHFSMLNTGLRALADFDYLFDEDGGYLALRRRTTGNHAAP